MNRAQCNITFDDKYTVAKYLIRRNAEYWLDAQGTLHEKMSFELNKNKIRKIFLLLFALLAFFISIPIIKPLTERKTEEAPAREIFAAKTIHVNADTANAGTHTEMPEIYDRCSREYLTEPELTALCRQEAGAPQLQFCINLMYARHGYIFKEGSECDIYFNKQGWYQQLEKGNVSYDDLNIYERANSDLIVRILIEEGYREG